MKQRKKKKMRTFPTHINPLKTWNAILASLSFQVFLETTKTIGINEFNWPVLDIHSEVALSLLPRSGFQ